MSVPRSSNVSEHIPRALARRSIGWWRKDKIASVIFLKPSVHRSLSLGFISSARVCVSVRGIGTRRKGETFLSMAKKLTQTRTIILGDIISLSFLLFDTFSWRNSKNSFSFSSSILPEMVNEGERRRNQKLWDVCAKSEHRNNLHQIQSFFSRWVFPFHLIKLRVSERDDQEEKISFFSFLSFASKRRPRKML